ncbi:survival factor 1 [Punctularia strigosozonata HHB-11173 SS5]|uniref:Survival factor 1 n=1 Tax=Punctularia strigosozonata (strain HHB-11173) TaxID=741275 RepID=R7S5R0_PUNST|nr:survival factor 1 [Punctularia strigosozonata HHB-11173 SS5]EIN04901.1 survival factor 1 [Punctularia strigosozonata HHB-11173 SS5]
MFSYFSSSAPADPNAPNFHPVSERYDVQDLFGELEPKDLELQCQGSGFVTETQTFYHLLEDGTFLTFQLIHSSVGLWYPQIQFTCKTFNPRTKEKTWKSVNISHFVCPPPGLDKRSSKADQFSITHKPSPSGDNAEGYTITANLADDLQLSLDVTRPASTPGFKVGKGPKGGYSYFGYDPEKADGYVIHRFWPLTHAAGTLITKGQAIPVKGPGMFVHAIQGMRPNLVASRWNFAYFESAEQGGVTAVQMDFTTLDTHGRKGPGSGGVTVSVGGVVLGGKLASVTTETRWPDEPLPESTSVISRAIHLQPTKDAETGYDLPTEIEYKWAAPSIVADAPGEVNASLRIAVGGPSEASGLVEKVDVLGEIPYALKMAVNYVAGTKPYIYQWLNPATLVVKGPDSLIPGLSAGLEVQGRLYNEATFIS